MVLGDLATDEGSDVIPQRCFQLIFRGEHMVAVYIYGEFHTGWDRDREIDNDWLRRLTDTVIDVGEKRKAAQIRKVLGLPV